MMNILDNMPGIVRMEYVLREDVDTIAEPIDGKITVDEIVLNAGAEWSVIDFVRKSASSNISADETDGGMVYKYSNKFRIAKDSKQNNALLAKLAPRWIVLKEMDANGTIRLIGSKINAAKFGYDVVKSNSVNGYDCVISHTGLDEPIFVE